VQNIVAESALFLETDHRNKADSLLWESRLHLATTVIADNLRLTDAIHPPELNKLQSKTGFPIAAQ
jgi:hypothetical protein